MQIRVTTLLFWLIQVFLIIVWVFLLRPGTMGGPAGYIVVSGRSMVPTFSPGDLAVTLSQPEYAIDDIVTFRIDKSTVIHRIVDGTVEEGFLTSGDGNKGRIDSWRVRPEDISGRLWFVIPGGGRYITQLIDFIKKPLVGGLLSSGISMFFLAELFNSTRRHRKERYDQRRKRFRRPGWRITL